MKEFYNKSKKESSIMSKFIKNAIKATGNKYASVVSEGSIADTHSYYDTGSLSLNAAISGSIFRGIPNNKVTCFCGDPATGKTFYALSTVKLFLDNHPKAVVFYFDSEFALTTEQIEDFGIDTERFVLLNIDTVENFRHQCLKILKEYEEETEGQEDPEEKIMIVLDSLGQLSKNKQVEDIESGSTARDMTKAQLIKGAFAVLTHKAGALEVPLILTNHVYQSIGGMMTQKIPSGGSGMIYASSNIIHLTKSKEKKGNEQVGVVIKGRMYKSRKTKENKIVKTRLFFESGLDRYYGLLDIALAHNLVKKKGNKIVFPDGSEGMANHIYKNPEQFFTDDFLQELDKVCKKEFMFGGAVEDVTDSEEAESSEEE